MKDFTFEEVRTFIEYMNTIYPVVPLRDAKDRCIVLRQDVDLDIYPSLKFADIQKAIGVRSTFFVLVTSPYYNILSPDIRRMLKELTADGFEVGLHFDPSLYSGDMEFWINREKEILEYVIDGKVKSVSFHNPSVHVKYPIVTNLRSAYDSRFFSDSQYLSDSMREIPGIDAFRGKDPYKFIKEAKIFPMQVCLHPEQYFTKNYSISDPYSETISRYITNLEDTIVSQHTKTINLFKEKTT